MKLYEKLEANFKERVAKNLEAHKAAQYKSFCLYVVGIYIILGCAIAWGYYQL